MTDSSRLTRRQTLGLAGAGVVAGALGTTAQATGAVGATTAVTTGAAGAGAAADSPGVTMRGSGTSEPCADTVGCEVICISLSSGR